MNQKSGSFVFENLAAGTEYTVKTARVINGAEYTVNARTRSIERKAAESGINIAEAVAPSVISAKERSIIRMLYDFSAVVRQAGTDYSPSGIANYAYELAKEYNQFYHDYSILREEDATLKAFRILLTRNVGKVIKIAMNLLGIDVPERM